MLHVTHDLSEALFLGDDILSIVKGNIAQNWLQHQVKQMLEDEAWLNQRVNASRVIKEGFEDKGNIKTGGNKHMLQ